MEITIKGEAKEIATFVLEIQRSPKGQLTIKRQVTGSVINGIIEQPVEDEP